MVEAVLEVSQQKIETYPQLRRAVTETLIHGQRKIEALKVQIYWKTGKLIQEYLKRHPDQLEGEKSVLTRLSEDFEMERTLFYRVLQFANLYSSVATWRHLTWSHYRELLGVSSDTKRLALTRRANANAWPVRVLREAIKKSTRRPAGTVLMEPPRRVPGTYAVKTLTTVDGGEEQVIDFGFYLYGDMPGKKQTATENIFVKWNPQQNRWAMTGRKEDRHYYEGRVQKVVDGDTLRVLFRPGFGMTKLIYLRFRAIDAEKLETKLGQKARDFLAKKIKTNALIEFHTHLRDSHHRWVADVWHEGDYLNQLLLDKGLAEAVSV